MSMSRSLSPSQGSAAPSSRHWRRWLGIAAVTGAVGVGSVAALATSGGADAPHAYRVPAASLPVTLEEVPGGASSVDPSSPSGGPVVGHLVAVAGHSAVVISGGSDAIEAFPPEEGAEPVRTGRRLAGFTVSAPQGGAFVTVTTLDGGLQAVVASRSGVEHAMAVGEALVDGSLDAPAAATASADLTPLTFGGSGQVVAYRAPGVLDPELYVGTFEHAAIPAAVLDVLAVGRTTVDGHAAWTFARPAGSVVLWSDDEGSVVVVASTRLRAASLVPVAESVVTS